MKIKHISFIFYFKIKSHKLDLLDAGLDVKYLIIVRCREGTLHKQNTKTFAAMIPTK